MLKKLIFSPIFIIFYAFLLLTFKPFLNSYDLIFSLSSDSFIQLITVASLFCLTSLSFGIFATLAQDLKIVAPVGLLASILPMFFLNPIHGLILSVTSFAAFAITFITLGNKLKNYLTFNAPALLIPSFKSLITFLILAFSIIYFLSVNQVITKSGFQIPDSFIDSALNFMPQSDLGESANINIPKISNEQLEMLKKNPALLKQSGLDPKILESLSGGNNSKSPQNLANNLIKDTVKSQVQGIINPYIKFVPIILTVLLFFTLQSLTSLIGLLAYPLLWIIFLLLEKTGFIRFEIEQRPVKKLTI